MDLEIHPACMWELRVVLQALLKALYESLCQAFLKYLTYKTDELVSLATPEVK